MLTTEELEVSYHLDKLYTSEAKLTHQQSVLKYARVPLASVYLFLTQWHCQDTPLLLGTVYKTKSSSSLSSVWTVTSQHFCFTIWLPGTAHVRTFQAVLSALTAQSGATPFNLQPHRTALDAGGRVVGIACSHSPSWLHLWDVHTLKQHSWFV